MSAPKEPEFRILAFSNDGEAEAQLRAVLAEKVAEAKLPARVVAEKGVITAAVDLIIGLSAADVDRAVRFLPEGATVAFTAADLADALNPAASIDPRLLVTDVRRPRREIPPTVSELRDAIATARRNCPTSDGEGLGDRDLDKTVEAIVHHLAS